MLVETLRDNFNSGANDPAKWTDNAAGGGSVSYSAGTVRFNFPNPTSGATLANKTSVNTYDLTESYIKIKPSGIAGSTKYSTHEFFRIFTDANNYFEFDVTGSGNTLKCNRKKAGSAATVYSVAYNSTNHAYWRIRESEGVVYWDVSANGIDWNNIASYTHGMTITAMYVLVGYYSTSADYSLNFHPFIVDDFNLVAPTVTTSPATSILGSTATGNGDVTSDGDSTITQRGVCWSENENPTTADNKQTASGTTGAFTANMTGLSPDTVYHYRAYAINTYGTSYGEDQEFTTTAPTYVSSITDSITPIESFQKEVTKSFNNSISFTEFFSSLVSFFRTFTDSPAFTESLIKSHGTYHLLTDSINYVEFLLRNIEKIFLIRSHDLYLLNEDGTYILTEDGERILVETGGRGIENNEVIERSIVQIPYLDSLIPVESLIKSIGKTFSNSISFIEFLKRNTNKIVLSPITLVEVFVKSITKSVRDSISLIEKKFLKYLNGSLLRWTKIAKRVVSWTKIPRPE